MPPKPPLLMHTTWSPGRAAFAMAATSASTVSATTACPPIGSSASRALGRTARFVASKFRPDATLLMGDQVYLDAPFYKFIYPRRNRSLARTFLQNYADTWGQNGDGVGFHQVLSNGPNVFTADDHEFWNNAPFPSFAANSVLKGSRKAWFDMALGLYRAFQTEAPLVQSLEIGELSIRMVDTRVARSDDRTTLIPDSEMDDLEAWIRGLRAPGILAIGQPVFAAPAGFLSKLADWNLPDFTQYERLCKALLEAPQSVLILTGDVHFGRAARVVTDRGAEIVEIVASPMSLVTGLGGRGWHAAPPKLPAHAIKKVASQEIERLGTWERAEDHFLILELWSTGGGLGVRGHSFEANPKGTPPSNPVFTHTFRRQA